MNDVTTFKARREGSREAPVNLVIRSMFNPNMRPSWFNSVVQVINSLTILAVIALICERTGYGRASARHSCRAAGGHAGEDHRQRS
jgi:hypothetical protein